MVLEYVIETALRKQQNEALSFFKRNLPFTITFDQARSVIFLQKNCPSEKWPLPALFSTLSWAGEMEIC